MVEPEVSRETGPLGLRDVSKHAGTSDSKSVVLNN